MKRLRLHISALLFLLIASCSKYEVIHQGPISPNDTLVTSIIPKDSILSKEQFLWSTHNSIFIANKNLRIVKVITSGIHSHISRMAVKGDFSRFALAHDLSNTPISIYDRDNKIVDEIDNSFFNTKISFGWIDSSAQFYILESDGHISYTQSHNYAVTELSSVISDFDYAIHANVDKNGIMYLVYKKKLTTFYFIERIDLNTGDISGEATVGGEVSYDVKFISILTNPTNRYYATVYVNVVVNGESKVINYIVTPSGIYYGSISNGFYVTSDFGASFFNYFNDEFSSYDNQGDYNYDFNTTVQLMKVKDE